MDWKRFLFVALVIIIIVGVVVVVGRHDEPPAIIISSMLATTIAVATPITLGALCGLFCERAGVVNIGIEGMMLSASFFGWFASVYVSYILKVAEFPSLMIGVVVAVLTGALMGSLHAVLSITFKVDQVIGGTVINILAVGITGFLNRQFFFERGSVFAGQVPYAPGTLPHIRIPLLADIPVIGGVFDQQLIATTAVILVFIVHFIFYRTPWGLRTRAVGEHPRAADTVGINVFMTRYVNVIIGGMLAGLAGAYFTLESVPKFEPQMTGGRGFIALAALIFGNWSPIGAWMAALVFGAAQAMQINLQFFRESISEHWMILQNSYIIGLIPYLLTIIIMTGIIGKTIPPAADGTPYEK